MVRASSQVARLGMMPVYLGAGFFSPPSEGAAEDMELVCNGNRRAYRENHQDGLRTDDLTGF